MKYIEGLIVKNRMVSIYVDERDAVVAECEGARSVRGSYPMLYGVLRRLCIADISRQLS